MKKIFLLAFAALPNLSFAAQRAEYELVLTNTDDFSAPILVTKQTGTISTMCNHSVGVRAKSDAPASTATLDVGLIEKSGKLKLSLNVLGAGYVGGGQDGPTFSTSYSALSGEEYEADFNTGFLSKTPELSVSYNVNIKLKKIAQCSTPEECCP